MRRAAVVFALMIFALAAFGKAVKPKRGTAEWLIHTAVGLMPAQYRVAPDDIRLVTGVEVDALCDRYNVSPEVRAELRGMAMFTVNNKPPVFINQEHVRWTGYMEFLQQDHGREIAHILAADLLEEAVHASGEQSEAKACASRLGLLQEFYRRGNYFLDGEIRAAEARCARLQKNPDHGVILAGRPPSP